MKNTAAVIALLAVGSAASAQNLAYTGTLTGAGTVACIDSTLPRGCLTVPTNGAAVIGFSTYGVWSGTVVAEGTTANPDGGERAFKDLATLGDGSLNTVVEAIGAGMAGNSITVALTGVADQTPDVTLSETSAGAVTITYDSGAATVAMVETAIATSRFIRVKTTGTGATVLTMAAADFAATALAGGGPRWDALDMVKVVTGAMSKQASTTAAGTYLVTVSGHKTVRIRFSAYTSGALGLAAWTSGEEYVPIYSQDASGNLSVALASGSVIDVTKWGGTAVAGGTGVDTAGAPRVSLATNVALPAGTNLLGKVGIDQTTPGTTNLVQITDGAGAVNTIVDSSALPSGAATSALQGGGLPAALDGSGYLKTHEQGTAAVSAASLPLPTGAATSALQGGGLPAALDGSGYLKTHEQGTALVGDGAGAFNVIVDSGTTAVTQATAASLNAQVVGATAHDAALSDKPVAIGAYAEADGASIQVVSAEGNISYLKATLGGELLTSDTGHGHPNRIHCYLNTTATTSTLITGCGAPTQGGFSIYITDVMMSSSAASTTAANELLQIQSGTGGSCGTPTVIRAAMNAANDGFEKSYKTPTKVAANAEICILSAMAGTKTVEINGFLAQ